MEDASVAAIINDGVIGIEDRVRAVHDAGADLSVLAAAADVVLRHTTVSLGH
jgi:hypothetical protein